MGKPAMYVDPITAGNRKNNYANRKMKHIPNDNLSIDLSIDSFKQLVTMVNDVPDSTGMQVYFACYTITHDTSDAYIPRGKQGDLILVFVPSKDENGNDRAAIANKFYTINVRNNNSIVQISDQSATKWINHYLHSIYYDLLSDPDMLGNMETKAIWFNKGGLIELDGILNNTQFSKVTIHFAAYTDGESVNFGTKVMTRYERVDNQLTIIFTVIEAKTNLPFAFTDEETANMEFKKFDDDDYDTGLPCPPAQGC